MAEPRPTLVKSTYDLVTFSNGKSFPRKFLIEALTSIELVCIFARVYNLSPEDFSKLILQTSNGSPVAQALLSEANEHSQTLQDFVVDQYYENVDGTLVFVADFDEGEVGTAKPVHAEILPEVWKQFEVEIAKAIQDVADKIADTIGHMPGRTGEMVFQTLATVNAKRPVIGDYRATIQHKQHVKRVLVVFDVSGSMSEPTVRTIVDDVVGLAYEANAALAIVSNTCTYWDAGAYNTDVVLAAAEYGGTHYEQLAPLFSNGLDWDVVITIADYDSSYSSKDVLGQCTGRIGELFDISLVQRSTFLAECLGQLADKVRPLMVSSTQLM